MPRDRIAPGPLVANHVVDWTQEIGHGDLRKRALAARDGRGKRMNASAWWRRLDVPGHDAASISADGEGWLLRGMAVFGLGSEAAGVAYEVAVDRDGSTRRGELRGDRDGQAFHHLMEHRPDGWYLDGRRQQGMDGALDLDFGFTPSTNLLQMRRVVFECSGAVELPVAWFDLGMDQLEILPQRYERRGVSSFWYEAPTVGYQGMLELADNGFIASYPGLWSLC
ncbi:putative glycolipid-binding domain-containing protein [Dyella sp. 2RAB6]|uniref:putative glycolipid-binding domain-containing protein n=1 Tax=Dyella sp. 2RAB6 TaxID=3232992 RepID=UPI003F8DE1E6